MEKFQALVAYYKKAVLWNGKGVLTTTVAYVGKSQFDNMNREYKILTFDAFEEHKGVLVAPALEKIKQLMAVNNVNAACDVMQELLNNRATTRYFTDSAQGVPIIGEEVEVMVNVCKDGKNRVKALKRLNDIQAQELPEFPF